MSIKSHGVDYRRHSITTLKSGDGWQAKAYRGHKPIGETVTAPTRDSAILVVKRQLDEAAAKQRAMRGADGFPTVDEVRAAWPQLKLEPNSKQQIMLDAHLDAPDHVMTATLLAKAAGSDNYQLFNNLYGTLGHKLADELDWQPQKRKDGTSKWITALVTDADGDALDDEQETTGHWRCRLRPEIVAALAND